MPGTQFYVLVAIPLIGILLQSGLFMHLAHCIDKLAEAVAQLSTRAAVLEEHRK